MEALEARDWARLHPELLEVIAVRLTDVVDRVGFSSVCPQWRSASKSVAHDLPPQLPWLLLREEREDAGIVATARRFFSLSHNRIFNIPLPDYRMFPSPCGRIVVPQGIKTLALLNPLTRSSVTLPPLPLTESMRMHDGAFVLREAKVFASNLVAVVFPFPDLGFFFCWLGDSSWKRLDMISSDVVLLGDFVYYKGKFFVIQRSNGIYGPIWVFDADTLRKISEIPLAVSAGLHIHYYLVESFAGDLLLVIRMVGWDMATRLRFFQLDESEEKVKWMDINSIGDNVLFVDGVHAMAFEATDSNGWRRNCVYFVDGGAFCPSNKGAMLYNVGEGEIEKLSLFPFASSWWWQGALWVVPTLC